MVESKNPTSLIFVVIFIISFVFLHYLINLLVLLTIFNFYYVGNERRNFFSHYRIEPSLCAKHDIIFGNIVAVRQYVWTPLQGVLPNEDNTGAKLRNMNNYEINLEGSGDFKEDAILDFVHDVSNMIGGCNASSRGDHFRFGFYQKM